MTDAAGARRAAPLSDTLIVDVSRFVDRITALVAPGTESDFLDVDAAIAALLGTD